MTTWPCDITPERQVQVDETRYNEFVHNYFMDPSVDKEVYLALCKSQGWVTE